MRGATCSIKLTRVQEIKDGRISQTCYQVGTWDHNIWIQHVKMHPLISFHFPPTPQYVGAPRRTPYELVPRMCARSSLRRETPEMPKSSASVLKNMVTYPPLTHTFLKRLFLTDFKKYTHTTPYGTKFWRIGRKIAKRLKKCEFAPCWHIPDVPKRYGMAGQYAASSGTLPRTPRLL